MDDITKLVERAKGGSSLDKAALRAVVERCMERSPVNLQEMLVRLLAPRKLLNVHEARIDELDAATEGFCVDFQMIMGVLLERNTAEREELREHWNDRDTSAFETKLLRLLLGQSL